MSIYFKYNNLKKFTPMERLFYTDETLAKSNSRYDYMYKPVNINNTTPSINYETNYNHYDIPFTTYGIEYKTLQDNALQEQLSQPSNNMIELIYDSNIAVKKQQLLRLQSQEELKKNTVNKLLCISRSQAYQLEQDEREQHEQFKLNTLNNKIVNKPWL